MLDLLLQLFAFGAVLIGIRGHTWDHAAAGYRRVTPLYFMHPRLTRVYN